MKLFAEVPERAAWKKRLWMKPNKVVCRGTGAGSVEEASVALAPVGWHISFVVMPFFLCVIKLLMTGSTENVEICRTTLQCDDFSLLAISFIELPPSVNCLLTCFGIFHS